MKRSKPLKRTPFLSKPKPMKQVSSKRRAYRASQEGKDALAYMAKVKQLPCCICGAPGPSEVHHVIHNRFGSRKSSDFDTVALCAIHHRIGEYAIHNGKERWRERYGNDYDFIEMTRRKVEEMICPESE